MGWGLLFVGALSGLEDGGEDRVVEMCLALVVVVLVVMV